MNPLQKIGWLGAALFAATFLSRADDINKKMPLNIVVEQPAEGAKDQRIEEVIKKLPGFGPVVANGVTPAAHLEVVPTNEAGHIDDTYTATLIPTPPPNSPALFRFRFKEGEDYGAWSEATSATHIYREAGRFTITMQITAKEDRNHKAFDRTLAARVVVLPLATLDVTPARPVQGVAATLTVTLKGYAGQATYIFYPESAVKGQPNASTSFSHIYAAANDYEAKVVVTTGYGQVEATKTISVLPARTVGSTTSNGATSTQGIDSKGQDAPPPHSSKWPWYAVAVIVLLGSGTVIVRLLKPEKPTPETTLPQAVHFKLRFDFAPKYPQGTHGPRVSCRLRFKANLGQGQAEIKSTLPQLIQAVRKPHD